jgi:DNA replication and repair protein RecF
MLIDSLQLRGVRNLSATKMFFHPQVNLFCGPNGSGKTSLLESIHFLSLGRSHRTSLQNTVIKTTEQFAAIFAAYQNVAKTKKITIKTIKHREQERKAYLGGGISTKPEIAGLLPVQIINDESSKIIFKEPETRRKFIDWIVFYANKKYQTLWKEFNRALQQRNFLLKQPKQANKNAILQQLDQVFVDLALQLQEARSRVWQDFLISLENSFTCLQLNLPENPTITLFPGWSGDLSQNLLNNRDLDIKTRTTHCGPHRADLQIKLQGQQAKHLLSRGQGKSLAIAMIFARALFVEKLCCEGDNSSIMMIDDLGAELDQNNFFRIVQGLKQLKGRIQVFITGTDKQQLLGHFEGEEYKMFSVNAGRIEPCST